MELSALPELNYRIRIFSLTGRDGKYDDKDINDYPINTVWEYSNDNRVLRSVWQKKFFLTHEK